MRALQQENNNDTLYFVCVFGLSRMILTIFKTKSSVEKASIDRSLFTAAEFGDFEVARLLLYRGADVSAANKYGQTPLHCAAENCSEEVV